MPFSFLADLEERIFFWKELLEVDHETIYTAATKKIASLGEEKAWPKC
jgi:hypothetical protein